MNRKLVIFALILTAIVAVVSKVTSISLLGSLFVGALGMATTVGSYLFVASDIGDHVAAQAKEKQISTLKMWVRVCTKSVLILFVPALVITILLVVGVLVYDNYR